MRDSLLDALGAQSSVAPQNSNFLRRFYVAHFVDERGHITLVCARITFCELPDRGTVAGCRITVRVGILLGIIAPRFRAGSIGLVWESQAQPQVGFLPQTVSQAAVQSGER